MDTKELRDKTTVELEKLLTDSRNRLRELRFRVAAKQLSTVREIRQTRRLIAQLLTMLGERKQAEPSAEPKADAKPADKPAAPVEDAKAEAKAEDAK
jgi:ribosomal protein L29